MKARRLLSLAFAALPPLAAPAAPVVFAPPDRGGVVFEAERCGKPGAASWRVIRFKRSDRLPAYPSGGALLEAAAPDVEPAVGVVSERPAAGRYRAWVRFALPQQADVRVDPCSVAFRQKGRAFPTVSFDVPSSFLPEELRSAGDLYAWREYGVIDVAAGEPLSVVFSQESSDAFDSVCASFDCVYLSGDAGDTRPPPASVVPADLHVRFIVAGDGIPMKLGFHGRDGGWKKFLGFAVGTGRREDAFGNTFVGFTKPGATSDWANATLLSDFADIDFKTYLDATPGKGARIGEGGILHYRVQLSSSPGEEGIFFDHEVRDDRRLAAVGAVFNPVRRTFAPDFAFAREVAGKLASLPPARGRRPVRLPVATPVHADRLTEEVIGTELANIAGMGFNSFGLGTPIPFFVEHGPRNGFRFLDGQQFGNEFNATATDADGFERHDPEASDRKAARFAGMLRENKIDVPFCSLADEPGMGFGELLADRRALRDFPRYLAEQGVTAAELGIPSLAAARPARYEKAPSGAMHYWSMRYFTKVFGDRFRGSTRAAAAQGLRTGVNFACQVVGNVLWDGADWFRFYRDGTLSYGWCEDWFNMCGTYQFTGFQMAVMRAACEPAGVPYGAYCIVAGRPPWDVGAKAFAQFARKLDGFKVFSYGPHYTCDDSFDTREPALLREVRDVNFALGAVEDSYIASRPLRGDAALLYSTTSDIWNCRGIDWFPASLFGVERSTLYLLLGQCGVRADVVYEGDLAGRLGDYKSLFATGSHIHADNLPALVAWVKAGGALYLGAGALERDQYDRPTDLAAKLGFRRGEFKRHGEFQGAIAYSPAPEAAARVTGFGGAIPVLYGSQPVEGKALARRSDRKAAVAEVASGKGKVVLCGFMPGLSHFKRARRDRGKASLSYSDYPGDTRALMRSVLKAMGVAPAVESGHPMVEAHLLVAPGEDLLVLSNWSSGRQKVDVKLRNGTRYREARAIRADNASLSAEKDGATTVSLTVGPGDFVVLSK